MKKCKRLCSLLLAVCLILSMAVPAVFAENDADAAKTVEYSFSDYESAFNSSGNISLTGDPGKSTLNTAYDNGTVNSTFFARWHSGIGHAGVHYRYDNDDLYAQTKVGNAIALKFKSPGDGNFNISVLPRNYSKGAQKCEVYIYSAEGKTAIQTDDMVAANLVTDSLNLCGVSDAQSIGSKTFEAGKDYLIVFKPTVGCDGEAIEKAQAEIDLYGITMTSGSTSEENPPVDPPVETPAENMTYSFNYVDGANLDLGTASYIYWGDCKDALTAAYKEGKINSIPQYHSEGSGPNLMTKGISATGYVGRFMAIKIKSPGTGTYSVDVLPYSDSAAPKGCNVYIVPADTAEAGLIDGSALTKEALVGNVNLNATAFPATAGNFEFAANTEYLVVFQPTLNKNGNSNADTSDSTTRADFKLAGLELSIAGSEPEGGITVEPVDPTIAAMDAVGSGSYKIFGSSVVNGHDYIYFFMQGETLAVYDLDTKELVDVETNSFNTPRAMTVDSEGIVWAVGSSSFLYRYDPYNKVGERISFDYNFFEHDGSFNGLGVTVDENDKVYFGTYNRAYIGMYDPETKQLSQISGWLDSNPDDELAPDAGYAGWGGIIARDGFLYVPIDGNKNGDNLMTHELVKFDLTTREIVDSVDLTPIWGDAGAYVAQITLVDDVIICGTDAAAKQIIAVDISGDMKLIDIPGMPSIRGFGVEIGGKVYFTGQKSDGDGLYAYDKATKTGAKVALQGTGGFEAGCWKTYGWYNSVVTIEGDDRLPGESILACRNNTAGGTMEPVFMNPETLVTVKWDNFTAGIGSGNALRSIATDEEGKNIYLGAFGFNAIAQYNVEAGKVINSSASYDHQTDGLFWYDGNLYAGNYETGTITLMDMENKKATPFFNLRDTVFYQARMHAMTAGDGKVFAGTTPYKYIYGGVLVWYDLETKLTYVAAGPTTDEVFYADTSVAAKDYVWYRASDNAVMDFDDNDDGEDDYMLSETEQRFTGLIKYQTVNCIVYKDGYIYGTTSKYGGQLTTYDEKKDGNAKLFVYDVAAMKVIATHDLSKSIEGMSGMIQWVDVIAEDPEVPGKFWGVVADTLFSFTFDPATGFSVKEELSLGKSDYKNGGNTWDHRSIVFDGDFMYVILPSTGIYMVNKADPANEYCLISKAVPKQMVMAADGKLYYIANNTDLMVLDIAETVKPIKDDAAVKKAQALIDALPDANITLAHEAAIIEAREAYDALSEEAKETVNAEKLTKAEAALAPLRAAADQDAADVVTKQIDAIGEVNLESEEAIKAARAAYEALTADQKTMVDTAKLAAVETKLEELKAVAEKEAADKDAADAVTKQIDAIGTVTLSSKDAIKAARAAYDALTADQKALVSNLKVLTAAEVSLGALENPKTGDSAAVAVMAVLMVLAIVSLVALAAGQKKKRV